MQATQGDEMKAGRLTNWLATPLPWQGSRASSVASREREMELFQRAQANNSG